MTDIDPRKVPFIYNLFPKLVGKVERWGEHVERGRDMGFNWLFLNPLHLTGASGSLYAVRDYFRLSPLFFEQESPEEQWKRFARFVETTRQSGMEVMVDLVINHTAYDNPLTRDHRNWYKINDDGSIKSPGAHDDQAPGGYVEWGDLSEIDNTGSSDKQNLHEYWWKVVEKFLDAGVRGFRCDAAYQVPVDLWKMLIERAKERAPETTFFAETLGCPLDQTLRLAEAGHDFTFNSGKWWNYRDDWFLDQLREMQGRTRSVCFPESHDTERLAAEWNGDVDRIKQHYLFTALISTGVMILMGFEYGFRKKPHVVHTIPHDYEGANFDLTDFIRTVNEIKATHRVFQEDNRVEVLQSGRENVLALRKTTNDQNEAALLLINRSDQAETLNVGQLLTSLGAKDLRVERDGQRRKVSTLKLARWGTALLRLA